MGEVKQPRASGISALPELALTRKAAAADVGGGFTAAVLALPHEVVFGAILVAPLGVAYAAAGIRAALFACLLWALLSFVMRATPGIINGSRSATMLVLAGLAAQVLDSEVALFVDDRPALVFAVLLACTATAGALQLLLGTLRWGRALKYIPFPVLSGLSLGVALLTAQAALRPTLGISPGAPWSAFFDLLQPWAGVVAGATFLLCFFPVRRLPWLPSTLIGLAGGIVLHYLLSLALEAGRLGPQFPRLAGVLPEFQLWTALPMMDARHWFGFAPTVLFHALAIAAFASLESLLCLRMVQVVTHRRESGDRELLVQGAANLVAGLAGGVMTAGALPRCRAVLEAGGRSRLAGLAFALALVVMATTGGQWATLMPWSVASGMLLYLAWTMVDAGTRGLFAEVLIAHPGQSRPWADVAIVLVVAAAAVLGNLLLAAALGLIGATILFTLSSIRPVVRRVLDGLACRSCTARDIHATRSLEQQAECIVLMELQGSLFFGTAEQLAERMQALSAGVRFVILDFEWLRQVDNSGAQMLAEMSAMLAKQDCRLFLSAFKGDVRERLPRRLAACGNCRIFSDRDQALSAAEDSLLGSAGVRAPDCLLLEETVLARGLSVREVAFLEAFLMPGHRERAGYLFRLGEEGASLMVAANRSVEILLPLPDGRQRRIASVAPGVAFGEMAVLDARPRSADAWVDGPVDYWALSRAGLEALGAAHPAIAFRLLANLGLELSGRLRATTRELRMANQQEV